VDPTLTISTPVNENSGRVGGKRRVWTQRDQIQAYQFLRRRLVSALVAADANHPVSPSRRLVLGTVLGVVVTLLVTAVFGVIGLLNPSGGADWLSGGHVIVEEGTGARFILGQDNALHPVLNYASARLLAGGNGNATVTVSSKNLATAPRGSSIGIAGAPDSLPAADGLAKPVWDSCSRTTHDAPAKAEPTSTVLLGTTANGRELGLNDGLLVRTPDGVRYLIASGHRFRLSAEAGTALRYDAGSPITVSARWIDTVPAGRDLGPVPVDGAGQPGPRIGTKPTVVGQILVVADSLAASAPSGYYLVGPDGVRVVTETEASLILQTPENAPAYAGAAPGPVPVTAADLAKVGIAAGPAPGPGGVDPAGYPPRIPGAVRVSGDSVTVCTEGNGATTAGIFVSGEVPLPAGARTVLVAGKADPRVADEVYVPPSSGAVVAGTGGTVYLVTDTGMKYPVVNAQALAALGYGAVSKLPVSNSLLALVPTGPALDPAAAGRIAGLAGTTG
jgi:type VII secretion protein EccB